MSRNFDEFKEPAKRARPETTESVAPEVREHDRQHDRLLKRSLGPGRPVKKATDLSGSVFLGAAIVGAFLAGELWWAWVGVGLAACLGLGLMEWSRVWYPAEQRRWLDRLPFEFDMPRYLASLSGQADQRHLEVEVVFQRGLDRAQALSISALVESALPGAVVQMIRDDTLQITGPTQLTRFVPGRQAAGISETPIYDNSPVHAFFRRCVQRGLKPAARMAPIRRVAARAVADHA